MSRSKIFNMIKNRGTQENGRNPFDLSGFESYSEKCQTINILRCIDTIPKDYFDIKISDFTQCAGPMKTAAFVRGTREICAYYVPYNSIWHNFNQYQATREDPDSTLLQQKGIAAEPRFSLFGMYIQVAAMFAEWLNWRYFSFATAVYTYFSDKTFDKDAILSALTDPSDSVYQYCMLTSRDDEIQTYMNLKLIQLVGSQNLVTNSNIAVLPGWYLSAADGGTNYFTSAEFSCDTVGNPCWADCCRKLEMLGYGNIYPVFDVAMRNFMNENAQYSWPWFLNQVSQSADLTAVSTALGDLWVGFEFIVKNIVFQLKYLVHIGDTPITNWSDKFNDQYLNVYPMFAYNRCFYDMFRNSYYDLDYDVRNYNCDFVNCNIVPQTIIYPVHTFPRFWQLEHHQYKKDMFTGVLPDTQFGAVSSVNISSVNLVSNEPFSNSRVGVGVDANNRLSLSQRVSVLDTDNVSRHVQTAHVNSSVSTTWSIPSAFDVFALRRAECLQQYRMDLLRAGNKTRDIFKQIYGSNPKSELDEAPYFIDVFGNSLNIDPIIATANTEQGDNGALGDIAARVTSRGDGTFKFSTEDFGCLLILDYTLIDTSYNCLSVDAERFALSQEQHFIPQLQNLGFEAVFGLQLNMFTNSNIKKRVLGYAPPYLSKKTYVDKVHGNMVSCTLPSLSPAGEIDIPVGLGYNSLNYVGSRAIWTCTRKDMQDALTVQLRHFYGNPNILDDVMVLQYEPSYEADQFICHTLVTVNSVRQLAELGLPRFC